MRYSQEALEELSKKIDLLEYAGRSVDFVKCSGDTYFAICPFHKENTPSLAVNTTDNFYYCFGCGRYGNIFTWIQSIEHVSFNEAVKKVIDLTGSDINDYLESESMAFYKLLNRLNNPKKKQPVDRTYLDINKDYREKYLDEIPPEWLNENILPDVMKKYEIRIDQLSNRIVYPVLDSSFKMIGVKGRSRFKNYKELGIIKYSNYNKLGILDFFCGMKQAEPFINESNEVIILEGLKSVMKVDGWGYHNAVSAETSVLNEYQVELLIRMRIRDIVIAFDKDISRKKIEECTKLLKRFANVFVVIDRWGLLKEKESPCDEGEEVWKKLYEGRVRI